MPLKVKFEQNVTQLHYDCKGIITAEMEYIAIRENQKLQTGKEDFNQHQAYNRESHMSEMVKLALV